MTQLPVSILVPDLTPSQQTLVEQIADAVTCGDRVCIRGAAGSGRSTVLRAAAGRIAASSGQPVAVLDAQSSDRLAWDIVRRTSGKASRPRELTIQGVYLFLDNGDCHVRIREEDPIVIVGEYDSDTVVEIPAWSDEDIELAAPEIARDFENAPVSKRCPRHVALAVACRKLGISTESPLSSCRTEHLAGRLLDRVEIESPLSIDFLFAASELGNLPISTDWFAGWGDLSAERTEQAAVQLHQLGLIDPHSPGEWSTPTMVRKIVRDQMSVAFRQSAAASLATRLLEIAGEDSLGVLPHLTTLWKRLRKSHPAAAGEIWEQIYPQWTKYGFQFHDDATARPVAVSQLIGQLARARQLRQRGLVLEAENLLATAVRNAAATLPADDPTRFDVRLEYAELGLAGSRRAAAVAELRDLLASKHAESHARQRRRIENDLASALFYDGRYAEAAAGFRRLATDVATGRAAGRAWNNAGEAYRALGELGDAEAMLRQAISAFDAAGLEEDPAAVTAMVNLAGLLGDTGRDAEAEPLFAIVAQRRCERDGADAPATVSSQVRWAACLCELGETQKAAEIINEICLDEADIAIETAIEIISAIVDRSQGRNVKAELRLLRLAPREDLPSPHQVEAARLLAEIYAHEGRFEEAARWTRLSLVTVEAVARLVPVAGVRAYLAAASVEEALARWDQAERFAGRGLVYAEKCGNAVAAQRDRLGEIHAIATPPGESDADALTTALAMRLDQATPAESAHLPLPRLAEHVAAESLDPSRVIRIFERAEAVAKPVPNEWLTIHAALATLVGQDGVRQLWERVASQSDQSDGDHDLAHAVLASLEQDRHSAHAEDADLNEALQSRLSGRSDRNLSRIESVIDAVSPGLATDEDPATGHALDDLF